MLSHHAQIISEILLNSDLYSTSIYCDVPGSPFLSKIGLHCSTTHFHVTCSKYFLLQTTWSTLDVFKLVTHESVLYCVVPFMSMLTLISKKMFIFHL